MKTDSAKKESRKATFAPAISDLDRSTDESGWLASISGGLKITDILTANNHTQDFKETRAEYINSRLRFMLGFYALAVPLWIPVDLFTLSDDLFQKMSVLRLGFSLTLIFLLAMTFLVRKPIRVSLNLVATVIAAALFYYFSMVILYSQDTPELAGYVAMPYLMVVMLGLFPSTITYSAFLIAIITASFCAAKYQLGTLASFAALNELWLLVMLSGITLWIQSGQLLMLLKLYRESTRDALTGLINRRVLVKRLAAEIRHSKENQRTFSLMMLDLDRFKRINDQYGHFVGDRVLKMCAQIIDQQVRKTDLAARFGGEEFLVVLPGLDGVAARAVAERVRVTIEEALVETVEGDKIRIQTSIGVTEYEAGESLSECLNRVDELLYLAKRTGRNQVNFGQSEHAQSA